MTNAEYPTARRDDLVVQETNDEVLVYDLRSNTASCLNSTAAMVWGECDGTKNVDEITGAVSVAAKVPVSEDLVRLALSHLSKKRLLEKDFVAKEFSGSVSRRDAVRRIGVASVIALPVIATMVAPVAAQLGSSCNVGVACTCTQTGMDAGGAGMPCAPVGTGGCNSFSTCVCQANDNGSNFSGMCGL